MKEERLEIKVYKIGIWPILYTIISMLTQYIVMGILCVKDFISMGEQQWVSVDEAMSLGERFETIYYQNSSLISIVSICLTLPVLLYFFIKEEKTRNKVKAPYKAFQYMWIVVLGCSACVGLSRLVSLIPFQNVRQSYEQVEQVLFDKVFWVQIATICLLVPIAEEVIYRGMVFRRLREYMPKEGSILLSALIFGLFHFNIMQGLYAFGIGILCAFVYEKYGNIIAAMLLHISANSFSIFLTRTSISSFFSKNMVLYIGCMLIELSICVATWCYIAYKMPDTAKKQKMEQASPMASEQEKRSTFDIYG